MLLNIETYWSVAFGSALAASSLLTQVSSCGSLSVLELHAAMSDDAEPTIINIK